MNCWGNCSERMRGKVNEKADLRKTEKMG